MAEHGGLGQPHAAGDGRRRDLERVLHRGELQDRPDDHGPAFFGRQVSGETAHAWLS